MPHARQLHSHRCAQRNTFVCRAKQHVKFHAAGNERLRIKLRQATELGAVVKQAGVEEIGALAPGLGLELAKAQNARFDGKLHKIQSQSTALLGRIGAGAGAREVHAMS